MSNLKSPFLELDAPAGSTLTLATGKSSESVELYSKAGLELLSALWVKVSAEQRLMYEPKWFGVPVIQFPNDIVLMQELIFREKPTKIIECGVAHGGSLLYYASLFELMGEGEVIGVEVELREHNRKVIMESPFYNRVKLVDGSSISGESIAAVKSYIKPDDRVMVFLDSNHSYEHVKKELELYSPFVTKGSYIVAMDTSQRLVHDMPRGKPEWKQDNPWEAVKEFIEENYNFEIDPYWTRLRISSNECGFLRRIK